MSFSPEFSEGFVTAPPTIVTPTNAKVRLNCPLVEIVVGPDATGGQGVIANFLELMVTHATFADVLAAYDDFADIMEGHPGFPGGSSAPGSGGKGLSLGYTDLDLVEWWVTDVEGWEGGPVLQPTEVESATRGTWIDIVRARGREVAIRGMVVAPSIAKMEPARRELAAALSTPPHTGLLRIQSDMNKLEMPVALSEPPRIRQIGDVAAEFELVVKGRDVGTPGMGVWREGSETTFTLDTSDSVSVDYQTHVASRPVVQMTGPIDTGTILSDGTRQLELAADLDAGSILLIDCQRGKVSLDGLPARYMLTSNSGWLEVSQDTSSLTTSGTGSGSIYVTVRDLY